MKILAHLNPITTTPTMNHILIVGTGSAGRRHLRNFSALGCRVSAMDPRTDRLEQAAKEANIVESFTSLTPSMLESGQFSAVVIASPPSFHVLQSAISLRAGLPVLLEKPVSPDLTSSAHLQRLATETGTPLLLGYTYRWWPPLQELKQLLLANEIGPIKHVRCVMSAHLADWHPWERYQEFFMARQDLGGGALLDESHFIDLIIWLFGLPSRVYARVEKISDLEIDTDDNVDALFDYNSGIRVSMHLDLYGRPHEKYLHLTGTQGSLQWSFDPNQIRISRAADQQWSDRRYTCDRNDMFLAMAAHFLEVIHNRTAPQCNLSDGIAVMRVIEAMRQSSLSNASTPF